MGFVDTYPGATNHVMNFSCFSGGTERTFFVYTGGAPGSCSSYHRNIETWRYWKTSAETALLSGRVVHVYYDVCNGNNHVTAFSLRR
jgi:hypothetical protein